jgi:hypothetical protein
MYIQAWGLTRSELTQNGFNLALELEKQAREANDALGLVASSNFTMDYTAANYLSLQGGTVDGSLHVTSNINAPYLRTSGMDVIPSVFGDGKLWVTEYVNIPYTDRWSGPTGIAYPISSLGSVPSAILDGRALKVTGFIRAEEAGHFQFKMYANDGAFLRINNFIVIDWVTYAEATSTGFYIPNTWVPFELWYFDDAPINIGGELTVQIKKISESQWRPLESTSNYIYLSTMTEGGCEVWVDGIVRSSNMQVIRNLSARTIDVDTFFRGSNVWCSNVEVHQVVTTSNLRANGNLSARTMDVDTFFRGSNVLCSNLQVIDRIQGGSLQIMGNAVITDTLTTSNMNVIGTTTVINTYVTQTSNLSIRNEFGTGPGLSVAQKTIGGVFGTGNIAEFYDIDSPSNPALIITDGGNIGIGTVTPLAKTHIYHTGSGDIFRVDDETALDNSPFIIKNNGKVGIGRADPQSLLHVNGTVTATTFNGNLDYDTYVTNKPWVNATANAITSTKTVVIGTATPPPPSLAVLHVVGKFSNFRSSDPDGCYINFYNLNDTGHTLWQAGADTGIGIPVNAFGLYNNIPGTQRFVTVWDAIGNVGIGTGTPLAKTHIYHTGSGDILRVDDETAPDNTPFIIKEDGKVGIGRPDPLGTLHIESTGNQSIISSIRLSSYVKNAPTTSIRFQNVNTLFNNSIYEECRIQSGIDETDSSDHTFLSFHTRGTVTGGSTFGMRERMRIDSMGNIGIGVTNPLAKTHILHTGAGDIFRVDDTTAPDSTPFIIREDGNVGIGITSPGKKLTVAGSMELGAAANDYQHLRMGGGNSSGFIYTSYNGVGDGIHIGYNNYYDHFGNSFIPNLTGGTSRLTIGFANASLWVGGTGQNPLTLGWIVNSDGQMGLGQTPSYRLHLATDSAAKPGTNTWTVPSDAQLKEDIMVADYDLCYSNMKAIDLKYYKWKDQFIEETDCTDRHKLGWIAQDVQTVFPNAVNTLPYQYGVSNVLNLNADQVYAMMYGTVRKLMYEVEELKARLL